MLGSHYRDYFPSFHVIIYCSYFILLTRTCISMLYLTFWRVIGMKSAIFAVLFLCTITFNAKVGLGVENHCGGNQECCGLRHSPYSVEWGGVMPLLDLRFSPVNQRLIWVTRGLSALILRLVVPRKTSVQDRTLHPSSLDISVLFSLPWHRRQTLQALCRNMVNWTLLS